MLRRLRAFFDERGVLEVETPILSAAAGTDPALEPMAVAAGGAGAPADGFLQTSPEFAMKRLLAAGSGPIYQLCKVFRAGERGRRHNPEFTLLEWYRPGWGIDALMDEVAALVRALLERPGLGDERIAYRALFRERLGVDPWRADAGALRAAARAAGLSGCDDLALERDGWLDLLMGSVLEPELGRGPMSFVHAYPPSQAALARVLPGAPPAAARFELYLDGLELANGFDELTDAAEQRARFEAERAARAAAGRAAAPLDDRFLAALEHGLPASAGVALGLDRLLMCHLGAEHIDAVLAFPSERA